jgi:hypothetical protein
MQGGLQQLEIVGGRLLGEFDHHLARRNAEVAQQLQGAPRLVRGSSRDSGETLRNSLPGSCCSLKRRQALSRQAISSSLRRPAWRATANRATGSAAGCWTGRG